MNDCKVIWKKADSKKPETFALVSLYLERGIEVNGWWTGQDWDGYKLKDDDVVVAFRRIEGQLNHSQHSMDPRLIRKRKTII